MRYPIGGIRIYPHTYDIVLSVAYGDTLTEGIGRNAKSGGIETYPIEGLNQYPIGDIREYAVGGNRYTPSET